MTYQVTQLEQRGLLARSGSGDDERGVLAAITAAGRELVQAAFPGQVALVRENFLGLLDADERDALRASLERVIAKLGS